MIESHQQLLEKYYRADMNCIDERSSDITNDTLKLIGEVREYADKFHLDSRFTDADFSRLFEWVKNND